jgi:uncharacterized protein YggU (UPF0235/DUF167 family)
MLRSNLMMTFSNICFAYDANDPADKKILADAVAKALADAETEHEQNIEGLKNKNKELVIKLKAAQEGKANPQEVERLEEALEKSQTELKNLNKEHKKITTTLEETTKTLDGERTSAKQSAVESNLTDLLTQAKVPGALLGGAKALLTSKVVVEDKDGTRSFKVGDKSLSDFIKEWSQGDEGKHYVAASPSGGGGAGGARPGITNPNQTVVKRSDYEANPANFSEGLRTGTVTLTDD